jgi:hypothetical protein
LVQLAQLASLEQGTSMIYFMNLMNALKVVNYMYTINVKKNHEIGKLGKREINLN